MIHSGVLIRNYKQLKAEIDVIITENDNGVIKQYRCMKISFDDRKIQTRHFLTKTV